MQIMETMVNRHVDAIALAPSDRSAFKIALSRASRARIPVVIYDSGIDSEEFSINSATINPANLSDLSGSAVVNSPEQPPAH